MESPNHVEDGNTDEDLAATVEETSNNIPDRVPRTTSTSTCTTTTTSTCTADQLERCGRWLSSIPRDDVTVLRETPEYQEFLQAFERLGCAHRRVISCSDRGNGSSHSNSPPTVGGASSRAVAVTPVSVRSNLSDKMVSGSSANSINGDMDCVNSMVSQIMSVSSFADGSEMDAKIPAAISTSSQTQSQQQRPSSRNVFTQHTDDVIVRMLEFLECQSLIRASTTCSRFQQLAHQSAGQRTHAIAQSRQLCSVMQLLRAQEQIVEGDHYWNHSSTSASATGHVRVPMLLLGRRIVVTNAGDEDYNGTYYCTNANGNGFVFTKPRYPIVRVSAALRRAQADNMEVDNNTNNPRPAPQQQQGLPAAVGGNNPHLQHPHHHLAGAAAVPQNDASISTRYDGETPQPGQPLRCIISKRYSNDRLLWYMSKEVETIDDNNTQGSTVSETFHFWASLMILETATPDASRYPSQSSALTRQGGESWHSLSTAIRAPTVELMD